MIENGLYGAELLKLHHPSDTILLDKDSRDRIMEFREKIVGSGTNNVSDILWANTVPIHDMELMLRNGMTVRICIFDESLAAVDEIPQGETGLIGAIQVSDKSFALIGVVKGENQTVISEESFYENGETNGIIRDHSMFYEIMRLWHGIELALLNPQIQDVISAGDTVKRYTRETVNGKKRQRVVRYIKRHVIDGNALKRALTEYHRHCLAWYVIGHWRHYKDGRVIFIKPFWKGELRALKRNFDDRQREVVV